MRPCTFNIKIYLICSRNAFPLSQWNVIRAVDKVVNHCLSSSSSCPFLYKGNRAWCSHSLGNSRKYPYLYHGRLFGFPKGRGGSRLWNSEGMGRYLRLEIRRHGGVHRWDFLRRKCTVSSLKTLSLWTFIVRK